MRLEPANSVLIISMHSNIGLVEMQFFLGIHNAFFFFGNLSTKILVHARREFIP